jgi:hypothetical protein
VSLCGKNNFFVYFAANTGYNTKKLNIRLGLYGGAKEHENAFTAL